MKPYGFDDLLFLIIMRFVHDSRTFYKDLSLMTYCSIERVIKFAYRVVYPSLSFKIYSNKAKNQDFSIFKEGDGFQK